VNKALNFVNGIINLLFSLFFSVFKVKQNMVPLSIAIKIFFKVIKSNLKQSKEKAVGRMSVG
jgi:hypothetical protein